LLSSISVQPCFVEFATTILQETAVLLKAQDLLYDEFVYRFHFADGFCIPSLKLELVKKLNQSLGTISPAQCTSVMSGDGKSASTGQGKHLNGVIGSTSHSQKNTTESPSVTTGPSGDGDCTSK
jgi:hypothetical protein